VGLQGVLWCVVESVNDHHGEVAGPGSARASGGMVADLDRPGVHRTIEAYARGLGEYLLVCEREGIDPLTANRSQVALFVRELTTRRSSRGANVVALDSGSGLANATLQQRLVPVRLFYDFLVEEGLRESNPVGRGRYTPSGAVRGQVRPLVPRMVKLPWIPSEAEWSQVLGVFRAEPIRNRLMPALAYDAALRREELCSLRTDDLDLAHRTLRVRAVTTKTRRKRVVPYSAATGVLLHRAALSRARGPLFLSESRRNRADPLTCGPGRRSAPHRVGRRGPSFLHAHDAASVSDGPGSDGLGVLCAGPAALTLTGVGRRAVPGGRTSERASS
jgi:integrase